MAVGPDRFFDRSANWMRLSVSNLDPPRGPRDLHIGLVDELSDRELGSSIDGDEEIELALRGLHFGDVDVEEADRIGLELPPRLFVAFHLGQSADAVALQTALQRRAR